MLAWLTLHWAILPRLDDWRPRIEAQATAALGAPVRIGAIRVRSGGWVPSFEIDDLRVLDAQGREALHLARVVAALSPHSLLVLTPRFSQLLIEDVSLDLRRDRSGRFFVAGLDMQASDEPADPAALDWLLEQHEFVIRGGTLRWTDEMRDAPPLALSNVDVLLRNGVRRHELRIDATPPPDWGDRFMLQGRFTQPLLDRPTDWQGWSGEAYLSLPRADLAELRRHVDLPFELSEGRGALRAWIGIERGEPAEITADLALAAVSLRLSPTLPVLALAQLEGRFDARQDARGLAFGGERLSFRTGDGADWAPASMRVTLSRAAAGAPFDGGTVRADRLDLSTMALLAERLPIGEALHGWLAALSPQGSVQNLVGHWSGPIDAPRRFQVQALGKGLALAAGSAGEADASGYRPAGRPGLSGADVELSANEQGGHARVTMNAGTLDFPGVFDEAVVPIRRLGGRIDWQISAGRGGGAPQTEVTVQNLAFVNDDVEGTINGRWRTGPGEGFGLGLRYPGAIEISGHIERGRADRVARYLPTGVPRVARDYVANAVRGGTVRGGSFEAKGDLWHFPYVDGASGVFRINARAEGVTLAYVPDAAGFVSPWPAMTELSGDLEFDRAAMRIRGATAQLQGVTLRQVRGGIQDMVHEGVLRMEGQARGNLTAMLGFVDATPVGQWLGGALRGSTASGRADLNLALQIPIGEAERSTVRGALQLAGNDLRLQPGTPMLADARGRIDFTQRGLTIVGGRARVLGGAATFEGGTQADGSLRFSGQGLATAEGLFKAGELPALAPLAALGPRLRGQAPYRLQLGFPNGRTELLVTSSLAGLSTDLPAPLRKPASDAWPLRLQITPGEGANDRLTLSVGELLRASYEREAKPEGAVVKRGTLGVGTAAPPMPPAGVAGAVRVARLDVDAWRRLFDAASAPLSDNTGAADGAMPTQLTLSADELTLYQRRLTAVKLGLQQQRAAADTVWRAQLQSDQGEGTIEARLPHEAATPGQVTARFKRLVVPAAEAGAVDDLLTSAPDSGPRMLPALDIGIDDFHWRGRPLGAVNVVAFNRPSATRPGGREWRLERLRVVAPDATLTGQGAWAAGQRMALDFELELADSGRFAERMGAGAALRGGKGRITGQLSWAGSPLAPQVSSLDGRLALALEEGRFLSAEPGAARLLGVLSLQALPRRLLLDFRDVFQQGFGFDKVTGDVTVAQGVARTDNLRIVGVQAAVLIDGSADLQRETQDLRVVAVPEMNAGAASLAFAAINPAVALGSFLAQWVLREPMMAANTREFHITGGWTEPKVERVERGAAAPVAPASAASAASATEPGR